MTEHISSGDILDRALKAFGGSSGTTTEPSQSSKTPSSTLFQSAGIKIAPISTSSVTQQNVSLQGSGNVGAQAKQNQAPVASVQEQADRGMSACADGIRKIQGDVCNAIKSNGHDPGDLMQNTMAEGGKLGLLVGASPGTSLVGAGLGSMASKAFTTAKAGVNANSLFEDLTSKGSKKIEQILAEVEDTVRMQADSQPDSLADIGALTSSAPLPAPKYETNLAQIVADGHRFQDILALDPDKPNPKIIPEVDQFMIAKGSAAKVEDNLTRVVEEAKPMEGPTNVDTRDAQKADAGNIGLAGQSLAGIMAMKAAYSPDNALAPDVKDMVRLTNEAALIAQAESIAKNVYDREFNPPQPDQPVMV